MKIAYIGIKGLPSKSGAERAVEGIVQRLAERHEITVYCSEHYTPPDAQVPGIKLVRLPCMAGKFTHMTTMNFLAAWHAVLYGDYDLIHLHNIEASFVLPILRFKYRVVTTAHGRITAGNKWGRIAATMMRLMEFPYAMLSNAVTSVSLYDAQQIGEKFHRSISYIPNGIEAEPFIDLDGARSVLEANHLAEKGYILFSAGRIIPLKGAHLLLEALGKLKTDCPVIIIGDLEQVPEYGQKLRTFAKGNVIFLPFTSSRSVLLGLIQLSRLFVFPSMREAMSMMLLEAASAGAPILCANIPANTAILPEKALYFSNGSVDDLADKLQWALDHPFEIQSSGLQSRSWVYEKYSWDRIASDYEDLYRRLLKKDTKESSSSQELLVRQLATLLRQDDHEPPLEPVDWPDWLRRAEAEGVAPLIFRSLQRKQLVNQVPGPIYAKLTTFYRQTQATNILLFETLKDVLMHLAGAGIPVMVLKGAALADQVYHEIGLRQMGDLDLLVRPEDVDRALAALYAKGYQPGGKPELRPGFDREFRAEKILIAPGIIPLLVEIHWHLIGPVFASRHVNYQAVWERAQRVTIAGQPAYVLGPEDWMLHLAAHSIYKHRQARLLDLYDIDRLVRYLQDKLDWRKVLEIGTEFRWTPALARVLSQSADLFETPVPGWVLLEAQEYRLPLPDRWLMVWWLRQSRPERHHVVPDWISLSSLGAKGRYLGAYLFPSQDYIKACYPDQESWSLPLIYLHRLWSEDK